MDECLLMFQNFDFCFAGVNGKSIQKVKKLAVEKIRRPFLVRKKSNLYRKCKIRLRVFEKVKYLFEACYQINKSQKQTWESNKQKLVFDLLARALIFYELLVNQRLHRSLSSQLVKQS